MASSNNSGLVREYFAAYEAKDRKMVERLLSDAFTFTSPYDDRIDRRTYFEKCWPFSESVRVVRIEKLIEGDGDVFVRYEISTTTGAAFRNAEYFRCDAGRIKSIEVYFGSLPRNENVSAASVLPTLHSPQAGASKYLCLVYQEEKKLAAMPQGELDALVADCIDWVDDLDKSGRHVCTAGLQSFRIATTVRSRNGQVSTVDGPFTETKEQLGGFTLITARDFNEALQIASKLPAARTGSVEVRPVLAYDADLTDPVDRKVAAAIRRKVSK
jgi:ketosteroid isomerase-like protein